MGKPKPQHGGRKTLSDLVKKRGKAAVEDLQKRMNDEIRKKG